MYNIDMVDLGKRLREYRNVKGLSIQKLGDAIGKSKATVAKYENGEVMMDVLTVLEICNVLNIDLNDIFETEMHSIEKDANRNPFNTDLLYLYYISKGGLIISSLEIEKKKYSNYVLMKNGLTNKGYKQEYTGILECSYNTAFICLTNAISNPGLDKLQIEIDLHSKMDNKYYGMFLGISDNTHRPTARKCILMKELVKSKEGLYELFEQLRIREEEARDIIETKYWDIKTSRMKDYVINV